VWPKLGFSFAHSNLSTTLQLGPGLKYSSSVSNNAVALNIFVPIMLHPAEHFFAGVGPFLDTDLSGHQKVTVYGLKLSFGGWI
jgi:hypothetical protein